MMKPSRDFDELVKLVTILRKECPWDREQTHESIKDNLIEEAYEAVEAIDKKNDEELKQELGDLLLHVIFHSRMARERGAFSIEDVIETLMEKLIRRHPHVFGEREVNDAGQVAENWETIKREEGKKSLLDNLPESLPALIRARRMQEKAGNVGFDWDDWKLAWEKFEEELNEWRAVAENGGRQEKLDEFGDLLFSLVNVGRLLDIQAEDALRQVNRKFESRFRYIEESLKKENRTPEESTLEEMDKLWDEAKSKGL